MNPKKGKIIKKKGTRVKVFEKLAEDMVTNDWGMTLELKIKRRIKRDHGEDDLYLNIASSGGRWFITVPLYMWDSLKEKVDAMINTIGGPNDKK